MPWTPTPWPRIDWDKLSLQLSSLEDSKAYGSKERAGKRLAKLGIILDNNKIEIDEKNKAALHIFHQVGLGRMRLGEAYTKLEVIADGEYRKD